MPVTLDDLVLALDGNGCKPKQRGSEWYARCPVHDGTDSDSLSATEREGKLLVRCHSQKCSFMDILGALGLDPDSAIPSSKPPVSKKRDGANVKSSDLELLATYNYTDEQGHMLYQVLKYKKPDGAKTFRQRKPDGKGGWTWKLGNIKRVLYNLTVLSNAIREGRTIYIVEGEKDVETLKNHGIVATCNPGGAISKEEAWKEEWVDSLTGSRLVIIPDKDEPGEEHAQAILRRMYGKARTVRIINLPDLELNEDISDWIAKGHTAHDLTQEVRKASNLSITTLADFMQMDIPKRPWILEGLIKKGDLIEIHSWRGTGKTQFCIGLSLAVAAGSNMLRWDAPEPKAVIYVEGEMSMDEMRSRFLLQGSGLDIEDDQFKNMFENFILLQHEVLNIHNKKMRSLSSPEGLNDLECFVADIIEFTQKDPGLLVLDNLSCLHGGEENDATNWVGFREFLIRMRVMGMAVAVIHHSGKGGASRGHSTLEDQLDVVLKLDGKKYKSEEGAKFDIRFEKSRGLNGKQSRNLTAHLQDSVDNKSAAWFLIKESQSSASSGEGISSIARVSRKEKAAELRREGYSYNAIAIELGMGKHTVMKYVKDVDEELNKKEGEK